MKFHFPKNIPTESNISENKILEGCLMSDWQDWKWQMRHSLKTKTDYSNIYKLSQSEISGFDNASGVFQIRTTPYYALLGDKDLPDDPIRLMQTPHQKEIAHDTPTQEMLDPLGEDKHSVTKRLVHRYADRVLFLITDSCSVYCRYCTRKRFTGQGHSFLKHDEHEESLQYIREHSGIREVILSGGDPLTLSDDRIESILSELRKIEHIEIIRIGSRMPVVNPFRITDELVLILKKYQPIYFMTHFNHPKEITSEACDSLKKLVEAGIPVMNQMVLLNGVNNTAAHVQALSRRLLYLRVKPYYMFQCDPSIGTDHLRTSILDSLNIQKELWGHLSGLAMPKFSIDIPSGGGKVSLTPDFMLPNESVPNQLENLSSLQNLAIGKNLTTGKTWAFKGFDGVVHSYIDPHESSIRKPIDTNEYLPEWEALKSAKVAVDQFHQGDSKLHLPSVAFATESGLTNGL